MVKLWLKKIEFHGFRGLSGSVELCRGLNIIVGPNCSGKTALIEAIAYLLALNYSDLREAHGYLALLHAARGSHQHSMASIVMEQTIIKGIVLENGVEREVRVEMSKNILYESIGPSIKPRVIINIRSFPRDCRLTYYIEVDGMRVGFAGECGKGATSRIAVITPGIYPYDFFDQLVGKAKRQHDVVWDSLSKGVNINGKQYTVDVASDEWGRITAYVKEDDTLVNFYAAGRGLQRALIMKTALASSDIILVDEVESAMHPELLMEIASSIAIAVENGKQVIVTTQSHEATRFLVAALLSIDRKLWRIPYKITEYVNKVCSNPEYAKKLTETIAVISLNRVKDTIRSITITGCEACEEIVVSEDVRLLYTLVR